MITDKTIAAINEAAYEASQNYVPKYDCLDYDIHFENGFIEGAKWATERMSQAIQKSLKKTS